MTELNSMKIKSLGYAESRTLSVGEGRKGLQGNPDTGAQKSGLAAWYEGAHAYYTAVLSGKEKPESEAKWQEFIGQMNWAYQQMSGGWDPMAGEGFEPNSLPEVEDPVLPVGAKQGTINNIAWTGPKAEITFDGESRAQDIWSKDIILNVADLSVNVSTSITTDTRWQPPTATLKVIMTDKATGKESVYFIHDYDSKKKHVTIRTPEENEALKAQLEKINQTVPGLANLEIFDPESSTPTAELGTPPSNRKEGDTLYWDEAADGSSLTNVELNPTVGTDKLDVSTDNLNIKIKNRSWKVYVEKTDQHEYHILIKDRNEEIVREAFAHGIDAINIDGADEDNVLFKDAKQKSPALPKDANAPLGLVPDFTLIPGGTVTSTDPNYGDPFNGFRKWSEPHAADPQMTVNNKGGTGSAGGAVPGAGQKVNPNAAGDTAADRVEGDSAFYNNLANGDVHLTPFYGDGATIKKYDVTANGFKLGKGSFGDTIQITKEPNQDFYTILAGPTGKEQTFIVRAQSILLEASDATITYNGKPYVPGTDPKIKLEGEGKLPKVIEQLSLVTGKNSQEILGRLNQMRDSFPGLDLNDDGKITLEEVESASANQDFPPSQPNPALIKLLYGLDPVFQSKISGVSQALTARNGQAAAMKAASERLITLLKKVYNTGPDNTVTIELAEPGSGDWSRLNDLKFNGKRFHFTTEDNLEGKLATNPEDVFNPDRFWL